MEKNKKVLSRRIWLRPVCSWGPQSSFHAHVTLDVYNGDAGIRRSIYGSLSLRDCSDEISFDYNANNDKYYKKQLAAIDKLLTEVQGVRDAWVQAHDELQERGGWGKPTKGDNELCI